MKVANRIKANEDFGLAIRKGKPFKSASYTIHVLKTKNPNLRIGISVSKKLGNAVVRNRIKRQVRAMCGEIFDFSKDSLDIAIVVRSVFLEKTYQENKEMLRSTLSGANVGVLK